MAKEDSRTMVWVGIGALAAVGAGYLVWRFALSEEQRDRTKGQVGKVVRRGKELAQEGFARARSLASEGTEKAREMAEAGVVKARGMADDFGKVRARAE